MEQRPPMNKKLKILAGTLGTLGILWSVFYVLGGPPRLNLVLGVSQFVHVGAALFLPLTFLLCRMREDDSSNRVPWFDFIAAVLSFVIPFYMFFNAQESQMHGWSILPPKTAVILGCIMLILVLEGARRTGGKFFAICVVVLAASPFFVSYLPGILTGPSFGVDRVVGTLFVSSEGMFGSVMTVFILVFLLFIFFGVTLQVAGAGKFFTNIALAMLGEARGGAAKVAVIASALFGTITGSASANVMVSGSFTIPMMKNAGYKPHFAAAVEAAASEGGLIMPPVMGAVAFIMANFLGIAYWQVALAAIFPAILYFWCLFSQVHFYSVNNGIKGVPRSQVPPLKKTMMEGWHIIVTAIVLVWLLFIIRMGPGLAAMWSTVCILVLTFVNKSVRPDRAAMIKLIDDAARIFAKLAPILLAVGLIIGGLGLSGLDMSLLQWVMKFGNSVWLGLLVLAVAGLVLGTGLPSAAVYILLAILLAPGLEHLGLNRLAVHMSILYWGILADFTPPTAVTPMIAAGFAGAPPMKTTLQTMRFGAVIYFAPFFFVFHPVLLLQNFSILPFLWTFGSGLLGFWVLARGFEGFEPPTTVVKQVRRIVYLVASVCVLTMIWYVQIAGLVVLGGDYLLDRVRQRSVAGSAAQLEKLEVADSPAKEE